MSYHWALDCIAVAAAIGFGKTLSATVVVALIPLLSFSPRPAFVAWTAGTAWMTLDAGATNQLPIQLLFTAAAMQRCTGSECLRVSVGLDRRTRG